MSLIDSGAWCVIAVNCLVLSIGAALVAGCQSVWCSLIGASSGGSLWIDSDVVFVTIGALWAVD
jgi:hypothetical protein